MERETGSTAPSTNRSVEFIYRLDPLQDHSLVKRAACRRS